MTYHDSQEEADQGCSEYDSGEDRHDPVYVVWTRPGEPEESDPNDTSVTFQITSVVINISYQERGEVVLTVTISHPE